MECWSLSLQRLVKPELKKDPGWLCQGDLERLVDTRGKLHQQLLDTGYEVVDMSILLSKKCMADRLTTLTEQGVKVSDFNKMLLAVLPKYSDPKGMARQVRLTENWSLEAVKEYKELGTLLQGVCGEVLAGPKPLVRRA